jgi:hypothetical protein
MARNRPAALVRHKCRRTTLRAHECVCTGSTRKNRGLAQRWCAQANHWRRSHGDDTTPTTCARQGTATGGRQAGKCARRGSVLTRLPAKERQGLGSMAPAQPCEYRRQNKARRRTSNKGTTQLQGKGARTAMTAVAPASDRLSSMAGSQATVGLRGGVSRQRATHQQRAHKAQTRPRLEGPAPQQGRGGFGAHLVLLQAAKKARWSRRRRLGARLGEGAVVGGLNSSGSFAVHAWASPFRRPPLQAGQWPGGLAARRLRALPRAASSCPLPQLLLLPLSSSLLAVDREKSVKGRRRILGDEAMNRYL